MVTASLMQGETRQKRKERERQKSLLKGDLQTNLGGAPPALPRGARLAGVSKLWCVPCHRLTQPLLTSIPIRESPAGK